MSVGSTIRQQIEQAWAALQDSYAGLPDARLTEPGVIGDWSVKDVLAHVTTWEEEALTHLPAIFAGGRAPRYVTNGGIDAFNARMTERKRALSLDEVVQQLHDTHGRLLDFVASMPDDQLRAGSRARKRLRLDTYAHYPEHARAIRDWRSREGPVSGVATGAPSDRVEQDLGADGIARERQPPAHVAREGAQGKGSDRRYTLASDHVRPGLAELLAHVGSKETDQRRTPMKLAVPDLVSNSYFPAEAAVELGCFPQEGLDVDLELVFPVDRAYEALRDGAVDLVGGAAHAALAAFPDWEGVKLLCAQSQGMYWVLVAHRDLSVVRGDLHALRGRTIGAAPWVGMGLHHLLRQAGLDTERDVRIVPISGGPDAQPNFGLRAAQALQERQVDAFWANGMAAEIAVRAGFGSLVVDVRRGAGPPSAFTCTLPAIAATDRLLETDPDVARAVVRAVVRAQEALKADVTRAGEVGARLFPPHEAGLIADVVRRDLPFYDGALSERFVEGLNRFACELGLLSEPVPYEQVVAVQVGSPPA